MEYKTKAVGLMLAVAMAAAVAVAAGAASSASTKIPKESAVELGVTKTKPFVSGAVFIRGKYIEPPYVVERWGTGIRINGQPATGQIIDWNEFLKTQPGVKSSKSEVTVAAADTTAPAETAAVVEEEDDDDDDISVSSEDTLDSLFDDDDAPKPKKTKPKKKKAKKKPAARPTASAPTTRTVVTYSLDGKFVMNEASKKLLMKINTKRTEFDRVLRSGGFICFGAEYGAVTGDSRELERLLDVVPRLQKGADSAETFLSGIRAAQFGYFSDFLCEDLYNNRIDYRKLANLRTRLQKAKQERSDLDALMKPLF